MKMITMMTTRVLLTIVIILTLFLPKLVSRLRSRRSRLMMIVCLPSENNSSWSEE